MSEPIGPKAPPTPTQIADKEISKQPAPTAKQPVPPGVEGLLPAIQHAKIREPSNARARQPINPNVPHRTNPQNTPYPKQPLQAAPERVYAENLMIDHDLYKLQLAAMLKDIAIKAPNHEPLFDEVLHQHYYHTYDSSGKRMSECSPIGGHTHELIIEQPAQPAKFDKEGNETEKAKVAIYKCGPPMRVVRKRQGRGRFKKVLERLMVHGLIYDDHRHDVEFLKSDRIKMRSKNVKAAEWQSQTYDAKMQKLAGDRSLGGVGGVSDL